MAEKKTILNIPFDEAEGTEIAYDYSEYRNDATLIKCERTTGRSVKCIHFNGEGRAEINKDVLPLDGDFTLLAWIKPIDFPDGCTGKRIGVFVNTAELEGSTTLWLDITPDSWGCLGITKTGRNVTVFLNCVESGSVTAVADITGIAVVQDIYSTEYGYADLDEVKAYEGVLSVKDMEEEQNNDVMLEYFLDGVNFKDYGVRVGESRGVIDLPKLKTPPSVENDNYHGKIIDLSEKRYEERTITLNCWVKAKGKMDFVEKVRSITEQFSKPGTQRLMVQIKPTKPLVFDVYAENGIAFEKKWHDELMIGTFTLELKEADPIKRVVRHQRTGEGTATVSVSFNSPKLVTVSWGDNSESETVHGEVELTHTYSENGIYYVIVGGVLEEITNFNTNGIVVWHQQ